MKKLLLITFLALIQGTTWSIIQPATNPVTGEREHPSFDAAPLTPEESKQLKTLRSKAKLSESDKKRLAHLQKKQREFLFMASA